MKCNETYNDGYHYHACCLTHIPAADPKLHICACGKDWNYVICIGTPAPDDLEAARALWKKIAEERAEKIHELEAKIAELEKRSAEPPHDSRREFF